MTEHIIDCARCRDLLDDYRRSQLSPDLMKIVQEHLQSCPDCKEELHYREALAAALTAALPAESFPKILPPSVIAAISKGDNEQTVGKRKSPLLPWMLAAAVLVVTAVSFLQLNSPRFPVSNQVAMKAKDTPRTSGAMRSNLPSAGQNTANPATELKAKADIPREDSLLEDVKKIAAKPEAAAAVASDSVSQDKSNAPAFAAAPAAIAAEAAPVGTIAGNQNKESFSQPPAQQNLAFSVSESRNLTDDYTSAKNEVDNEPAKDSVSPQVTNSAPFNRSKINSNRFYAADSRAPARRALAVITTGTSTSLVTSDTLTTSTLATTVPR